ncbi:unnamed protein product (macronuclear) [Paramecium tetraurelia]|uniref:Uncharacterized protein n=1 Tax=Paramecium tetraurelia TaxID=5888 RepID=A0CWL5_PARTE|nr:uncharacterized protein GSPATT00001385001 [Paramecium tetraurelia]CAK75182.1 unnamed protein product [Paramecium tetraurelia]|eukprot:XP_001442579.1 hypothetical protein (macronuclear) [Paramecium tetraurelia strain d4-2]
MNFDAQTVLVTQMDKKRIIESIPFQESPTMLLNYKKVLATRIIEHQRSKFKGFDDSDQKF